MTESHKISDDSSLSRCEVLAAIMRHGGTVTCSSGRASSKIHNEMGDHKRTVLGLSALLRSMEIDGQILRDVRGKRTYEITLGDIAPHTLDRIGQLGLATKPPEPSVPATGPFVPCPSTNAHEGNGHVFGDGSVSDGAELGRAAATTLDLNPLADAILRRVGEILAGDNPVVIEESLRQQLGHAQERLCTVLEENQCLRRKSEEAGVEARAQKKRADGLALRIAQVETNLAAVLRPGARVLDDTARRELTRLMQAMPTTH